MTARPATRTPNSARTSASKCKACLIRPSGRTRLSSRSTPNWTLIRIHTKHDTLHTPSAGIRDRTAGQRPRRTKKRTPGRAQASPRRRRRRCSRQPERPELSNHERRQRRTAAANIPKPTPSPTTTRMSSTHYHASRAWNHQKESVAAFVDTSVPAEIIPKIKDFIASAILAAARRHVPLRHRPADRL